MSDIGLEEIEELSSSSTPHNLYFDISKILNSDKPQNFKKQLAFRETLIISTYDARTTKMVLSSSELKSVGGLIIDIQLGGPKQTNFIVFVSSQFTYENRNGGSQITSWIFPNLQTLEEKRKEFVYVNERFTDEKQLYVVMQNDFYFILSRCHLETTSCYHKYNSPVTTEGSNFLLMRYLALIRYVGAFETLTLYINGDLCQNMYYSNGVESAVVNNVKLDVIRIQRIIREKCGIVHNCITTLLLNGRIIRQEWENCNYVLHLNPLMKLQGTNQISVFYEWEKDLQLFSKYLDFKMKRLNLLKNYYAEHPELRYLITDYCQHLLLQKPAHILDFTMDYFQGFTREAFPYNSTYS